MIPAKGVALLAVVRGERLHALVLGKQWPYLPDVKPVRYDGRVIEDSDNRWWVTRQKRGTMWARSHKAVASIARQVTGWLWNAAVLVSQTEFPWS